MWTAGPDGLLGSITAQATADAEADSIVGRVKLGPGLLVNIGDGEWGSAKLRIKLYHTFGDVSVATMAGFTPTPKWPGLQIVQHVSGKIKAGSQFSFSVWAGPDGATPPSTVTLDSAGDEVTAVWPDGRTRIVTYDRSEAGVSNATSTRIGG